MIVPLIRGRLRGDERFAVTGASGWLGRTTLDLLSQTLPEEAFRACVAGFASTGKTVGLRSGRVVPLQPLSRLVYLDPPPTHILHFAYLTRDRVADMGVAPYVVANQRITIEVLRAVERFQPRGIAVASSGAVYGSDGHPTTDLMGNPYGCSKHLEELVLRRAAADVGGRSVVARIFSMAGAYITKPILYALGDLVLGALAGRPLIVRATGPVVRSYSAAVDIVAVSLAQLLGEGGDDDVVFDTGGTVVEIGELANLVRAVVGGPDTVVERRLDDQAAVDRYVGKGGEMQALAERLGMVLQPLDEQIRDTADYLRTYP